MPGSDDERSFFRELAEYVPTWCGPHGLLVPGVDVLLLDLASLKLRHVFPARGWSFVAADPGGRRILALDPDGVPHLGEAR